MEKVIVIVVFCLFYWLMCFMGTGTDEKNLKGLRSYPEEVQKIVRKHNVSAPKAQPVWKILIGNFILFTPVFSILGLVLKSYLELNNYVSAFLFFLALGEMLGLFDLVVIDLLWWRNTKRIRFSYLQDKSYYQDPSKHIGSFIRGIPLFAVIALASAWIVTVL